MVSALLSLLGLFGLPLAIGLPANRDDLGVMRQSVNQGDGARGVGKHGRPIV